MIERSGLVFDKSGDRRFCGTEEVIFDVFAKLDDGISLEVVVKKAGISSSTFYRHHKSINGLLHDYEEMIMERFRRFVKADYNGVDFRQTVHLMLIFIVINKKVIEVIAIKDNYLIIYYMVRVLKNRIVLSGYLTEKNDRVFDIYVCEVCGVIKGWQEDGFSEHLLMRIEEDIMYLTLTINDRLGKLMY